MKRKNGRFMVLGAVVAFVLVVQCMFFIAFTVVYGTDEEAVENAPVQGVTQVIFPSEQELETEMLTMEQTSETERVLEEEPALQEGYGIYADAAENLENNVFFDALVYTGYNIEKHRSDGLMWQYVLAANKRGKGWLSDITYNGGSDGYEVTEEGLPDIPFFERHGLVCASYATYVYFNYLPNVAGIDTSELTKPEKAYNANDWYIAAKDWVEEGYSENIEFEANLKGGFIQFEEAKEIPIGSIIAFCDANNKSDHCSHIVVYAGYANDYHWVFHVGNENGPEFCSVERMHFGPDPQWPIAIITTPEQVVWN